MAITIALTATGRFKKLVSLAQRPGTPEEGAVARQRLSEHWTETYSVQWHLAVGAMICRTEAVWTVHGLEPKLLKFQLLKPHQFEEAQRIKTPAAAQALVGGGYVEFHDGRQTWYVLLTQATPV